MLFGSHVSAAGGIENAPKNAAAVGCEVFQMFSRSPRGGKPTFTEATFKKFKDNMKEYGIKEAFIHAPYYINFASANNRIRFGSVTAIRDELEVGTKIGVKYVMFHIGSAKDYTEKEAFDLVVEGINKVMDGYKGTTELLIENSAGAGKVIGASFEEIGRILSKVKNKKIGICLDSCHSFSSGYDWRSEKEIEKTLKEFEKYIGLKKLKMMHWNDSKTEFNSHKDRHEDLGFGTIGKKAFELMVKSVKLKDVRVITETPAERLSDEETMKMLKKWREK